MNCHAKGKRHEKYVADWLKGEGYHVERGFKKAAFIGGALKMIDVDLFGAFDIVALRWPKPVRLIQVTAGDNVAERKRKAFSLWSDSEVWEHAGRGRYWIHRADGSVRAIDTREGQ